MESCHCPSRGVLVSPPEPDPLSDAEPDAEHAPITGTLCLATTQPCAQAFGVISVVVSAASALVSIAFPNMKSRRFFILCGFSSILISTTDITDGNQAIYLP